MRAPQTIDGATLPLVPIPVRRKPQPTSLDGVRVEMARVYRKMESGKRDTQDGSRLVYAAIAAIQPKPVNWRIGQLQSLRIAPHSGR